MLCLTRHNKNLHGSEGARFPPRLVKMVKDPRKPRGKMSSYAYFVQTCREEHKKKHPEASVNFSEFSKKCSERWKTMSPKEKSKFEDMAKQDKVRYEREMKNYIPPKGEKKKRFKDPNAPKRPPTKGIAGLSKSDPGDDDDEEEDEEEDDDDDDDDEDDE
ncbi:hypothetical protein AMELA_G00106440 [Ameiurus melas]|uniref:HMG box domain-containing protein n=1 Tax=Ameiurus melas TaxID=219545 RepID=A0A7J6AUP7_AMEME|nr:hypothetical protein AMELA_G00106440 [Ameiurus melas]